jgi:predicted RNA polymerase sigma factor
LPKSSRKTRSGDAVLLLDQNRALWDRVLVRRGLQSLERLETFSTRGPYAVQAAIAACHARANVASQTDWARIAPSPVVTLNRAVAVSMWEGPLAGLVVIDALASDRTLARYDHLPAARADMLQRLGRLREARAEFERAASLTKNERERAVLLARADSCMH